MELKNVSAALGGKPVLTDISFTLPPRSLTLLAGKNGSGKSTLLRCIDQQLPYSGEILLSGKPLAALSPKERAKRIALLPQHLPAPAITVEELVRLGRSPHLDWRGSLGAADRAAVEAALTTTDLLPLRQRPVPALSGGERQRAYLAMILAQDADILLLDEPTTYLDLGAASEFLRLLRRLTQEGKTVLAVMHDLNAAAFADSLLLLNEGRLADPADLEAIFGVQKIPAADGTFFYR